MATFNTEPQKTNDPSYLGTSQGTEKAALQPLASTPELRNAPSSPNYTSDMTYGKLFAGVGEVLDTTVRGVDTAVKDHIQTDLRTRLESIRDQFGVAQAQASPDVSKALGVGGSDALLGNEIPKAVDIAANRLGSKLDGLKARYLNGDLQNSAYWSRAEAEVRAVRAQYKGYENYIDQKSSDILGHIPANALRASVLQDVDQLFKKMQSASDKQTTFLHANADIIADFYPNYFELKAAGQEPPFAQIEGLVARRKATLSNVENQTKELNLLDKRGQANIDTIAPVAQRQMSTIVNDSLQAAVNVAGYTTYQDFFTKVQQKIAAGGESDEKEQALLRNKMSELNMNVRMRLEQSMNQPWSTNDPDSKSFNHYYSKDPAKKEKLFADAMQPVTTLQQAVFDKDAGMTGYTAAWIKGSQDATTKAVQEKFPVLKSLKAVLDAMGPQATSLILSGTDNTPGLLDEAIAVVRGITANQVGTGKENDYSGAWKRIKELEKSDEIKQSTAKGHIADGFDAILNSRDPNMSARFANTMFSPNFNLFEKIHPMEEANKFLSTAMSPAMTQRLNSLRNTPQGEQAWQTYSKWAGRNSYLSMKQVGNSITEGIAAGDIKAEYDPKTFTFTVAPINPGRIIRPGSPLDSWFGTDYQPKVDQINKVLRNYGEILRTEGKDPTQAIYGLANSLVNVAEPQKAGFFEMLGEAVKKQIKSEPKGQKSNFTTEDTQRGSLGSFLSSPAGDNTVEGFRNSGRGNLSDENIIGMDVKNIPENMSARDFIKSLQANPHGRRP